MVREKSPKSLKVASPNDASLGRSARAVPVVQAAVAEPAVQARQAVAAVPVARLVLVVQEPQVVPVAQAANKQSVCPTTAVPSQVCLPERIHGV